jgi:hypothetical protein
MNENLEKIKKDIETRLKKEADIESLKEWDSRINALDEAWERGYEWAKKEKKK